MLSLQPPSTGVRSKSRHHQQKPTTAAKHMLPAEPASPAKTGTASIIGITGRIQQNQHHMQTQASPAEANVTSRSHHNQHHHQDQTRQAASAVPAETSRTSSTSRRQHQQQSQFRQQKPPQNQHQNPKPAPLAKTSRNKHYQQNPPAEPASKPEASIISKNWQKQASPAENPRRTSIKTRSRHH